MSMAEKIEKKLRESLQISEIEVINDSYKHQGHAGDDGSGESHFTLILSSPDLDGLSRVAAQRRVYGVLSEEMLYIHALCIRVINCGGNFKI